MSKDLAIFEKSLSIGNLGSYIHWVNRLPMLSAEEEHELATRLRSDNDIEAARKLILSHLRLVTKIARGYKGYGLAEADLIQEGNIGLMKAVKRFDPEVGVRLVSYALHWIRAEIHEFVIKNWRIVKIATTKAQRKLFFNLRRLAKDNHLHQSEIDLIAKELNVPEKDVVTMAQRLYNHDQGFDSPTYESSDDSFSSPAETLASNDTNPANLLECDNWQKQQNQALYSAINELDSRSQDILQQRWLNTQKTTLTELAEKYSISAERVRQLETAAMKKIQQNLSEQFAA